MQQQWANLRIVEVKADGKAGMKVGESLDVRAKIELGGLTPDDVSVELYHGTLDSNGEIVKPTVVPMSAAGKPKATLYDFAGTIKSDSSGRHGYTVRILPHHRDIDNPRKQGLVLWA